MKLKLPKKLLNSITSLAVSGTTPVVMLGAPILIAGQQVLAVSLTQPNTVITSFDDYQTDHIINFASGSNNSSIDASGGALIDPEITIRQTSSTISITGGEVTVKRYVGRDSSGNATTLNVAAGATLNLVGTDIGSDPRNDCALVLTHWSGSSTLDVNGTLNVHNATVSSHNGQGTLNINNGGVLNVGSLSPYVSSGGRVTVRLAEGGTLNIGSGGVANNDNLTLNLDGGTIGIDGATGATGWTAEKALSLNGNVTFNTSIANVSSSSSAGTITLNSVDTAGHTLEVSGNGTLQVGTLTASTGTNVVTVSSGSTLQLSGSLEIGSGASMTIRNEGTLNYLGEISFSNTDSNGFQTASAQLVDSNMASSLTIEGNGSLTLLGALATYNEGTLTSTAGNVYYVATGEVSLSDIKVAASEAGINDPSIYVRQGATLNINGGNISSTGDIAGSKVTLGNGASLVLSGDQVSVNESLSIQAGSAINLTIADGTAAEWTPSIWDGIGSLTLNNGSTLTLNGNENSLNKAVTLNGATLIINGTNGNLGNDSTSPLRLNGESSIQLAEGTSCIFGRIETGEGATASISGGSMIVNVARTINTGQSSTLTVNSNASISAALTKEGTGTLSFASGATFTAALTVRAGEVVVNGSENTLQGVNLQAGKLVTNGTTTINGMLDISNNSNYTGILEVASGTTDLKGTVWLGAGTNASLRVLDSDNATLQVAGGKIQALGSDAAVITSGANQTIASDKDVFTATNALITRSSEQTDAWNLSWSLNNSKLTNESAEAVTYNGTATNSDFANASTGTTQVGKDAHNVTLKGNGSSATAVTNSDNGISAASVSTVTGTASTFTGAVTVTEALSAAALATDAAFISTGVIQDMGGTSNRVLFATDATNTVKSTFQSSGTGASLTLSDGATVTLGGALAASDAETFALTLGGNITLDFTTEVKAAIADLSAGTVFDVLLATNVSSVTLGSDAIQGAVDASTYITLAGGSNLELSDGSQLVLNGSNLILTGVSVVPEPATATLSLLALAALAARRRRKA